MPTITASEEIKTARHFGTREQTLAEAVNLVRNYLKLLAGKDHGTSGGIYTRMGNYLTNRIFTKIEFVEKKSLERGEVNYAKYQVRQALIQVRAKLKSEGSLFPMDISMIINHFEKY